MDPNLVRQRLQRLADRIGEAIGPFGYRAFCDSAPVMEVELATRAGLGWRGKHTLLIGRRRGSMSFIGTLYTDLPLAEQLPRTRSGKIMRRLLRDVAEGRNLGDTTTLADASVVTELQKRAAESSED